VTTVKKETAAPKKAASRKKAPTTARKPATNKKKTAPTKKRFPTQLKIALAGLTLILLSPFYYAYVIKFFASSWRWVRDIGSNPNYRIYESFGIRIPRNYSVHGIDVSAYQGKIDWQMVKSMSEDSVHISFAYIKATEGIAQVDPYFQRNWRECPKAGIICGAYHFFRPQKSGAWQAKFFLQTVRIERGDLPMMVDVETLDGTSPAKMREELNSFLAYVKRKTRVKPVIYSGLSFYNDYLRGFYDTYPLWLAHYYHPELKLKNSSKWSFWQHSDKAKVNGINHIVDFDVFNGDSVEFRGMLIK
jgi:lysozyme